MVVVKKQEDLFYLILLGGIVLSYETEDRKSSFYLWAHYISSCTSGYDCKSVIQAKLYNLP